MEKILLIGFALLILLGSGAIGTVMTDYDMGMMQRNIGGMGSWGCPMMGDEEIHMDEHCIDFTYEECEEMHEECEENMHKYCEHTDAFREDKWTRDSCPMRR